MVDFGTWRATLHQPADRAGWEQLTWMAEEIAQRDPERASQQWLPYALWHLQRWPDELRELPARWLFHLSRPEPYAPLGLARRLRLDRRKLVEAYLHHAQLDPVTWLDLSQAQAEDALLAIHERPIKRQRLKALTLKQNGLDGELMSALFEGHRWDGLTRLDLSHNPLGHLGARALVRARLDQLRVLSLSQSGLGVRGLEELRRSPLLTQLERLDLSELELPSTSVLALCSQTSWPRLTHLSLRRSRVSLQALRALLQSLKGLIGLDLSFCALDAQSVFELAQSPLLRTVQSLDLSGNALGDEGLSVILQSPHLTQLRVLKLHYNSISDQSVARLEAWPLLGQLDQLELWFNELGAAQRQRLRQHPGLSAPLRRGGLWL